MKSLNITLLLVAVISGFAVAFQAGRSTAKNDVPVQQQAAVSPPRVECEFKQWYEEEKIEVIVAKKDLPGGTLLEEKFLEDQLGTMKLPKSCLPPDVILNPGELEGKKLNRTLRQGNYFSATDVSEDSGIKIPDGMFGYAMKTDNKALGFIQPGHRVDIILTESLPDGKFQSSMVLRDLLVLAVDTPLGSGGREPDPNSARVCLAVTAEQSLVLSTCQKRGEVKLILRGPRTVDHPSVHRGQSHPASKE
jgi:pilus assembly protein CpaB